MKPVPLRDKIMVSLLPEPEPDGPVIRVSEPSTLVWGVVEAVGPEARTVTVGQHLLVNRAMGYEVGEYLIVPAKSVYAERT